MKYNANFVILAGFEIARGKLKSPWQVNFSINLLYKQADKIQHIKQHQARLFRDSILFLLQWDINAFFCCNKCFFDLIDIYAFLI